MSWFVVLLLVIGVRGHNYNLDSTTLGNVSGPWVGQQGERKAFRYSTIVSDAPECASVARRILQMGGNLADAAISGMVCMGVMHPQSSGIGGGLVAVHYSQRLRTATVLSARERAPLAANESMFDKLPNSASDVGGLAMAVPGEIKGFHEIYKKWGGRIPWSRLFQPSIDLLENGFRVDSHLAYALQNAKSHIEKDPNLRDVFVNKGTGRVWVERDRIRNPVLAQTLKTIASDGAETFYNPNSPLGSKLLQDLKQYGSIIRGEDLSSYSVQWQESIKHSYDHGYTLHTCGPPSTGHGLIFILRIMNKYRNVLRKNDYRTSQILVEAFKHTFGRLSNFGDPDDPTYKTKIAEHVREFTESESYLKDVLSKIKFDTNDTRRYYQDSDSDKGADDSGTAHLSIVTPDGDALSVTTTVGKFFGSKTRSPQTGIIFNNKMHNFETNPKLRQRYPANKIGPGKRPTSATSPSIHTDPRGVVKLVMGAAGGDKIITALSSVILNKLFLEMTLFDSIAARRLHHELSPMELEYEPNFNRYIIDGLRSIGHKVKETRPVASVIGITRQEDYLWGCLDARKPGSVDGLS